MRKLKTSFWTILLILSCLCVGASNTFADDDIPEVTQRVVRVSVVQGEAQIRRAAAGDVDEDDWERVVQNLPLVEGDEITTSGNARLEIQFDRNTYLRLGENSYLKIVNLRDEGVAVSLPQGVLSLNLLRFDKDNSYFEIDAPSTTVAAQKAGTYRVDAGDSRSEEVAVTVNNGGQARVYSANSGFTLRDGRMAKITISGEYAGEPDIQSAPRFTDDFEEWILERNDIIASRLQKAKYDEYYTDDFYGAEDLNGNGEWINTREYGYVWRPYSNTTSVYDNWSPYRYGQWRNLPYYGWTWVNDEPWGWATYHHGRWVYYNGYWAWTPYGARRASRSYWRPALVIFTTWGNNYCWYPLPYAYNYYNYNYYYNRRKTVIINNTTIINNYPSPTPTPNPTPVNTLAGTRYQGNVPIGQIPTTGIVTVPTDKFGTRGSQGFGTVSADTAKQIIAKTPERLDTPPKLPTRNELDERITKEIRAEQPTIAVKVDRERIKVGAAERKNDAPIDRQLREKQIFGDRQIIRQPQIDKPEVEAGTGVSPTTRNTGAVTRETTTNNNSSRTPRNTGSSFPTSSGDTKGANDDRRTTPRYDPPRQDTPRQSSPPVKPEPPRQQQPTRQPPRQPTFNPPPPRQDTPRSSPPPPRQDTQRSNPPPKAAPPPAKSEPAPERKSQPTLAPSKSEKDG